MFRLTKPQLRQLVAKAHELAARATNEINDRGCAFPVRLAPLVTQWLPLEDVGAALSSSKQWRATSEWAFQLVAARSGVAGAAVARRTQTSEEGVLVSPDDA